MTDLSEGAGYFTAGIHNVSFTYNVTGAIPGVGDPIRVIDHFVTIAHDAAINQAWFIVDGGAAIEKAVMTVQLIQELPDGVTIELTAQSSLDKKPDNPILMEIQRQVLNVGHPIYLRIRLSAGTATPSWFATVTAINGAIHLLGTK